MVTTTTTTDTDTDANTSTVIPLRRKKCPKCGTKKPRTSEYFAKHDTSGDGLSSYCKVCRNALRKRKQQSNIRMRLKHHIGTRVAKQCTDLPAQYMKHLERYLGYSISKLRVHLNKKLLERDGDEEGITLKEALNQSYHLDHIHPLSKFDVTYITDEAFRECWAIDNLEMIPAEVNLRKGSKVGCAE